MLVRHFIITCNFFKLLESFGIHRSNLVIQRYTLRHMMKGGSSAFAFDILDLAPELRSRGTAASWASVSEEIWVGFRRE